jgi:hypothetical protein
MARLFTALAMCVSLAAAPAFAQTEQQQLQQRLEEMRNAPSDPNLPAVDTMTCDQMLAELTEAGRRMNGQLDPSFGANAQSLNNDMQAGRGGANARGRPTAADAERNRERMATVGNQVADSMQGIDVNRMMAVSDRFQSERCPTPQ